MTADRSFAAYVVAHGGAAWQQQHARAIDASAGRWLVPAGGRGAGKTWLAHRYAEWYTREHGLEPGSAIAVSYDDDVTVWPTGEYLPAPVPDPWAPFREEFVGDVAVFSDLEVAERPGFLRRILRGWRR